VIYFNVFGLKWNFFIADNFFLFQPFAVNYGCDNYCLVFMANWGRLIHSKFGNVVKEVKMKKINLEQHEYCPSKVLCIGRNYVEHIKELNNAIPDQMVIFHKPNCSITQTLYAFNQEPLHYETEICFLVEEGEYIGVGLGLDLTKRNLQSVLKGKGLPWERAKSFNHSAVLSRFIALEGIDVASLQLELLINCVRVQSGGVAQMLYPPQAILNELKSYLTLENGDVVMTGTPQGVGMVHVGDVFLARLKSMDRTLIETEWVAQ
jgi:2-keto-4-pentenoate hydratase/2-oxohepta-3-ene-1,7-dioic acid hydratase in catechol pathway